MNVEYYDYFRRLQGKEQDELALSLTVNAEMAVDRPHTYDQRQYLPAAMQGDQVREFRDLVNYRITSRPLANRANFALMCEIVAYLDKYSPESATVSMEWTDRFKPATIIHILRPVSSPACEEEELDGCDVAGELVDIADYKHLRPAIRLRNLQAAWQAA